MKKYIAFTLALTMALSLCACGGSAPSQEPAPQPSEETVTTAPTTEPTTAPTATPEPAPVEVDEGLFSVTLTIPAAYVGDQTQETLDALREEKGYKSVTLNEDGSVTYVMTKAQHAAMIDEMATWVNDGLQELADGTDYPGIDRIEAAADFSAFDVYLNTPDLGVQEMLSALSLYLYGGLYNAFLEHGADNIVVKFINNAGEVIEEANSRDLKF